MSDNTETVDFKVSARITKSKNYEIVKAVEDNDQIYNKTLFIQQAIDFYLDHLNDMISVEERQKVLITYVGSMMGDLKRVEFWKELKLYE